MAKKPPLDPDRNLTTTETATALGITTRTLQTWQKTRAFPQPMNPDPARLQKFYSPADIVAWATANEPNLGLQLAKRARSTSEA